MEAAKKALAKGETLAGFLSKVSEESAAAAAGSGGGSGGGGGGGGPATPPSLKQRITDSVSSPLTTLFSRGEPRPSSSLKEEGGRTTGSVGEGEGEGRKRQPTALELMFMEGPGGTGAGGGGGGGGEGGKEGGEGEVARGDEQV